MSTNHDITNQDSSQHGSVASYSLGFLLSILLTLVPYFLVVNHNLSKSYLIAAVVSAAILQLWIQLRFFLHLNRGSFFSFVFTAIIVVIIVFGSLWIMHDLNYFMMDPIMNPTHQAP
jgi:cytochrome o ubiquinol oxidase operon protein cyoD